jgi:hypothetical protein
VQPPISFRLGGDHPHHRPTTRASATSDLQNTASAASTTARSMTTTSATSRSNKNRPTFTPSQRPQLPNSANTDLRRRAASPSELAAVETERARNAIFTWYDRFNELVGYCEIYGDCNVPQKHPANPQLGIVRIVHISHRFQTSTWILYFSREISM